MCPVGLVPDFGPSFMYLDQSMSHLQVFYPVLNTCCIVFQVFTGPLFVPHCDHHACESLRLYSSVPVWMMYASSSCMLLLLCFIFLAPVHEVCTFFYHQPHAFCTFFYPLTHVGCTCSVLSHFGPLPFFPFCPSFFDPYSYVVIHQVITHSSRVIESLSLINIYSFGHLCPVTLH